MVEDKMICSGFLGFDAGEWHGYQTLGTRVRHDYQTLGTQARPVRLSLTSHMVVKPKQTYLHYYKQIIKKIYNLMFDI
jgi:hypothetical protein